MIVLLRENAQNTHGVALAAIALRDALTAPNQPVVAIDAATLVSAPPEMVTPDLDERVLGVVEPVIDAHHARRVRRLVVTLPAGAEGKAPRLALLMMRHHDQRSFMLDAPAAASPADLRSWARTIRQRLEDRDPSLVLEPLRPLTPRIDTPRLRLTHATREQSEAYFRAIVGTSIFDTLIWDGPSTPDDILNFELRGTQGLARGPSGNLHWSIIECESNACIGGCGAFVINKDPGRLEIGYSLAPASHGKGYATEAVGAMVEWIFAHRAPDRIQAHVYVGNIASRRVLEKIGFELEGTLRAMQLKRGVRKDEWLFAITRSAWKSSDRRAR